MGCSSPPCAAVQEGPVSGVAPVTGASAGHAGRDRQLVKRRSDDESAEIAQFVIFGHDLACLLGRKINPRLWQTEAVEPFSYSESIVVAASPESLYALVTDIARTGEWSPICKACWWHGGDGPREGAWFSGRNEADGRVWETESQVTVAQPGREFAWLVGGKFARWGFKFTPTPDGTQVTETWNFLPEGRAMFREKYGPLAKAQINLRAEQAHAGIPVTLAAIKRIAEAGSSG